MWNQGYTLLPTKNRAEERRECTLDHLHAEVVHLHQVVGVELLKHNAVSIKLVEVAALPQSTDGLLGRL